MMLFAATAANHECDGVLLRTIYGPIRLEYDSVVPTQRCMIELGKPGVPAPYGSGGIL
jgi:hypothetical protein